MNRSRYFSYVNERLSTLAVQIENGARLNDLSLNIHAEDFFLRLMNELFDWRLENVNLDENNAEAIDLVDNENKIVVQVSSTATRRKIEASLSKNLSSYPNYRFVFTFISKDAKNLRKASKPYENPSNLRFDPNSDIQDTHTLLKHFKDLDIDRQRSIYNLVKKELGMAADPKRVESNLATIINILASEDWDSPAGDPQTVPYGIDQKILHNNLNSTRIFIDDNAIHHARIEKKYQEFDRFGVNKRTSVLNALRTIYAKARVSLDGDVLYTEISDLVMQRIQGSSNYRPIPMEELEMCVNILMADAFIRCKIFEDPKGRKHAAP